MKIQKIDQPDVKKFCIKFFDEKGELKTREFSFKERPEKELTKLYIF